MSKYRVLEREMVLHEIPYEVEADSPGEAVLKVATDRRREPCRDTEIVYEVNSPYMWEVYRAEDVEEEGCRASCLGEIDGDEPIAVSRRGFIGAREKDS